MGEGKLSEGGVRREGRVAVRELRVHGEERRERKEGKKERGGGVGDTILWITTSFSLDITT